MQELKFDTTTITANNQNVLNLALLADFKQEDVHDELIETEPGKDWKTAMQVIELWVAAGASVNAKEDYFTCTPLRFTLQLRDPPSELVGYLLSQGTDVELPDSWGRTPFFQLLTHLDATKEMVDRFKRIGCKLDIEQNIGNTPLHLAKDPQTARFLLSFGASLDAKNKYGETALHDATNAGCIDVVSLPLDDGANMELKDSSGRSSLHAAIAVNALSDRFEDPIQEVINYLLERGADMKVVDKVRQRCSAYYRHEV